MANTNEVSVRGYGRVQLCNAKTGMIESDSGWGPNVITTTGSQDGIVGTIGGLAVSSQVTHIQLATQTTETDASSQIVLVGEFTTREATTPTFTANGTLVATASWATNEATESNIGAIGLYGSTSGSSVMNVKTFATSLKTTDQTLNATMEWRFS